MSFQYCNVSVPIGNTFKSSSLEYFQCTLPGNCRDVFYICCYYISPTIEFTARENGTTSNLLSLFMDSGSFSCFLSSKVEDDSVDALISTFQIRQIVNLLSRTCEEWFWPILVSMMPLRNSHHQLILSSRKSSGEQHRLPPRSVRCQLRLPLERSTQT